MTSLSGTFFLNVRCVLSSLKSFYYDCLSIKCCIFGVASVVAFFMLLMAVFKDELLLLRKWRLPIAVLFGDLATACMNSVDGLVPVS